MNLQLIQQIHASETQFELAITGGGSSALSQLLSVPGASRSLLNGVIPYSFEALSDYLGVAPAQACSDKTARLMASQALNNASRYQEQAPNLVEATAKDRFKGMVNDKVIGVGATAALQTDRQRRGSDRIHVAIRTTSNLTTYQLVLDKEESREAQETSCCEFVILCIARHCITGSVDSELEQTLQSLQPARSHDAEANWQSLVNKTSKSASDKHYDAVMPGAFNPPHDGHHLMRSFAEKELGHDVAFELSIENVDKPDLDFFDMVDRKSILGTTPRVFSRAATFIEKSEVFPGATFIVGIDTLIRIDNKKYYGNSETAKHHAIKRLVGNGHRFIVFGRLTGDEFIGLEDVKLTEELMQICTGISESEFRVDLSSTDLRSKTTSKV